MARNYIQPGKTLTLTAPYARSSGEGALVGAIFGVALNDVANAVAGEFGTEGVWELAKTSAQAWVVGDRIFWNASTKKADNDPTTGILIGAASEAAANPSSTGLVRLNGTVPTAAEGAQAAIPDLTDNSGGASADGTIGAVTTFTPSVAWNGSSVYPSAADATAIAAAITALKAAVTELATKQNTVLATLRTLGLIASS
jgi:predicted RecA/RadA family phage recombinase